jgi:hypothetical protein
MILKDRRLTIRHVAECLKLSTGTTHHIISEVLGYNKVCARWVPRMLTAEINAPAHTSHVAMAAIHECGFELLCHPPYSPDLATSDFHLFRLLKDSHRGQVFQSDEVVIRAINESIEEQEQRFFLEGVKALEHRWEKCVVLRGDYVERM